MPKPSLLFLTLVTIGCASEAGSDRALDESGGESSGNGGSSAGSGGSAAGGGASPAGGGGTPRIDGGGTGGDGISTEAGTGGQGTGGSTVPDAGAGGTPTVSGLHTSGTSIVDGAGRPVLLRGVNRSGTEYSCRNSPASIFDGPSDQASVDAIAAWGVNAVRLPLNEHCWLGLNGYPKAPLSAASYRQGIVDFVAKLTARGIAAIVELHLIAPGTQEAHDFLWDMPDADHAKAFWADAAPRFASNASVAFELFNEPHPDGNKNTAAAWACWQTGAGCNLSYTPAGMQELVTAIRTTGATNLILAGGIQYANRLSGWSLADPAGNIAAAWHIYPYNPCADATCWDAELTGLRSRLSIPVLASEIGEQSCGGSFISPLLGWLDGQSIGYLAWTWDAWGDCWSLVTDYAGTPKASYGTTYRDHLKALGL